MIEGVLKVGDKIRLMTQDGYNCLRKGSVYEVENLDDYGVAIIDGIGIYLSNVLEDFERFTPEPSTKKLFVLIQNGGDGSYYPHYTFNEEFIKQMEELDEKGELEYDDLGCDGDGFHYETLTVPSECTLESLGIHFDCAED